MEDVKQAEFTKYLTKALCSLAESNKIQASHATGLTQAQLARATKWAKQNKKKAAEFADIQYEPIWVPANSAGNRSDRPILDTTDVEDIIKADVKDILPSFDREKEPETLTKQQLCVEAAMKKAFHNCTTHELSAITREGMSHYIAQSLAMQRINNFMLGSLMQSMRDAIDTDRISAEDAKPFLGFLNLLGQTSSIMKNEASALSGTLKEKDLTTAESGMLGLLARTPIKSNKVSQTHDFRRQAILKNNQAHATQRGLKRKKAIDTTNSKKQKSSHNSSSFQTTKNTTKSPNSQDSKSTDATKTKVDKDGKPG